jgi:hypothetical protein
VGASAEQRFLTLHALRIKGVAPAGMVAEIADLPAETVEVHLHALQSDDLARFRGARQLWQCTPAGRSHHADELARQSSSATEALSAHYAVFLPLNEAFKSLCGEWQLVDGQPNDHSDADRDRAVVARLVALDTDTRAVVRAMGEVVPRLAPYERRLEASCQRVAAGETTMFTGVMCGSYHDVWMELHEDLILTQGIDRATEGSY